MAVRFCPQCGTESFAGARFCHACGVALDGSARAAAAGRWQVNPLGAGVLGFFLLAGLGIWTAILSPAPPRPAPGAAGPRTASAPAAAPTGAGGDMPAGHPQVPVALPADVKEFIADLGKKAKDKPEDVDAWLNVGRVDARAARLDPTYYPDAVAAYEHVLGLDPKNVDALRGLANVHYDREQAKEAIPYYERLLALVPDDATARTDLGTMYLYAGDPTRAVATYKEVLRRNPSFLQAHYNLAVTYHDRGDDTAALAELDVARGLATEDEVRKQIDDMIATLRGERPPGAPAGGGTATAAAPPPDTPRSAYQTTVEQGFRGHPIMGPRIVRFEWKGPGTGTVLVQNFPMAGMPPAVREKFTARLGEQLRDARGKNPVDGDVRMEIADAASGDVMVTVTPDPRLRLGSEPE